MMNIFHICFHLDYILRNHRYYRNKLHIGFNLTNTLIYIDIFHLLILALQFYCIQYNYQQQNN